MMIINVNNVMIGGLVAINFIVPYIGLRLSSQLANSYFSEVKPPTSNAGVDSGRKKMRSQSWGKFIRVFLGTNPFTNPFLGVSTAIERTTKSHPFLNGIFHDKSSSYWLLTPSYHPFLDWDVPWNKPSLWGNPHLWKPPKSAQYWGWISKTKPMRSQWGVIDEVNSMSNWLNEFQTKKWCVFFLKWLNVGWFTQCHKPTPKSPGMDATNIHKPNPSMVGLFGCPHDLNIT